MARFHVYRSKGGDSLLLDVQADLLDSLNTRVVVPLLPSGRLKPARQLNPVFQIDGNAHVMGTQFLAAIPVSELGRQVASLVTEQSAIIGALDCLFSGV